jgi:alkanesulfonate monooxygenase SsuD/methylene tetrahydromethanopterin reductase-like flavin-dependent oxidoreductase (luciferase family)
VLFGVDADLMIQTAELAEESGQFHSVWVGDNLLSKPRLEAIVTLAALAVRTNKLKLGTICFASFPLRNLISFAIQWASLDILSGGRTIFSACLGGSAKMGPKFEAELAAMGIRSKDRVGRLEEGVELLRRFWSSEAVSFQSDLFAYENVEVFPKPKQSRVPIWIAVNPSSTVDPKIEERALRRVARIADGWQTDGTPPEVFRERWERILGYAQEYGRANEVTDSCLHLMVNINDDKQAAYQESLDFLNKYYGEGVISSEKLQSWLAFGPPSAVVEKIGQFIEAGCTTPVLRFTSWEQRKQLERCVNDVLPSFNN